jgi:hypothetical protein
MRGSDLQGDNSSLDSISRSDTAYFVFADYVQLDETATARALETQTALTSTALTIDRFTAANPAVADAAGTLSAADQLSATADDPTQSAGPGVASLIAYNGAAHSLNPFSGNPDIDGVLIGSKWNGTNLTFSFPTNADQYQSGYGTTPSGSGFSTNPSGFTPFNAAQQTAARYALAQIQAYTNETFTEITETTTTHATIRFAQTSDRNLGSAQAWFPSNLNQSGDVWFGTSTNQPFYLTPAPGNWGQATVMHELGHAMGLKHGHQNYTNLDLRPYLDPAGTTARWGSQAVPANHDGQSWTLMTYASDPGDPNGTRFQGDGFNQPQTYMQDDIAALQFLYGANFNTNSTDTVYTFSSTTGQMFINGVGQGAPTANVVYRTIWDGGGNDTYDLSNYSTNLNINLNPGAFSNFGMQLANNRPLSNGPVFATGNVANALLFNGDARSLIDNAIGGPGNDIFVGNAADNIFRGRGGNDTIDGGGGTDSAIFSGLRSAYTFTALAGNGARVSGPDGVDTLSNVERLVFDDQTVTWPIPDDFAATVATAGVVSIGGTATGNVEVTGDHDWFRVQLTAGLLYEFDLQGDTVGAGTLHDPFMQLFNSSGQFITSDNDNGGNLNSHIVYTPATSGSYYVDAGAFNNQANGTYRVGATTHSVAVQDVIISEGNDGTKVATFTVTRIGGTAAFDVNFTTADNTATIADHDYVANAGTLHFGTGVNSQVISVPINGDTNIESNETFSVTLSGATNGVTISDNLGIGTIFDDDGNHARDFNLDAHSDILWQRADGQAAEWEMNGLATAGSALIGPNPGPNMHAIATGDFNGDGRADILWQGTDGTPAIWLMTGMSIVDQGVLGRNPGPNMHAIATGDFNGDGHADILWQGTDGTPAIWLMNGLNIVNDGVLSRNPGPNMHEVATGDFNGDGYADILWQGTDGTPAIWLMKGLDIVDDGVLSRNPGPDMHAIATGDFNGDGYADILWQGTDGTPAIWLMKGMNIVDDGVLGRNPGATMHAVATGDFNNDHRSDILWHEDNGTPAIWLMNGLGIVNDGVLGFNPGADWHIVA